MGCPGEDVFFLKSFDGDLALQRTVDDFTRHVGHRASSVPPDSDPFGQSCGGVLGHEQRPWSEHGLFFLRVNQGPGVF